MQYKGMTLCDYCFSPVEQEGVCHKCSLTKESYHADVGLLEPGTNLLGKYIIGRILGRGGFGATYLAYSSEKESCVAIKEYFPAGMAYRGKGEEKISIISADKKELFQKGAKRFFEEAKTMARFNGNKNIVSVYEFFYANDTVYYSMEYLEGIDLKGYVSKKGGRISEAEAITIMMGVCDALVPIHSTGTLHRDISPDNVFICTDGTVKIIDFGAAKQVVGEQSQSLSVILKQGFAPVEQYQKDGKQGMWTDVYAVGATIYYAITGKVPDDAMSRLENPKIKVDSSINISQEFLNIIDKCMGIKINERYQSALELLSALKAMNRQLVPIGGSDYIQNVYNNTEMNRSGLSEGMSVSLSEGMDVQNSNPSLQTGYNPYNNASQYPQSQYPQSMYPQSMYPQSQYPQSQYPQSMYPQQGDDDKKSSMVKGLIIGASALVVVVLIIIIIVKLSTPTQPQMPMPPGPPPMGMPGGPPPMGMQGGPPPMGAPGGQTPMTGQ